MSRLPSTLIVQIIEELEEWLLTFDIPEEMQVAEYEEIIRQKDSELHYKEVQIRKLKEEVALLRKSIEDWKIT